MKYDFWLDQIPFLGVFVFTVLLVLLAIRVGIFYGNRRSRKPGHENEASLVVEVTATLALLGFLLVFTFSMAAENLKLRRQYLLDEVNIIGTTYLRAGYLAPHHSHEIRDLLREYVDMRVEMVNTANNPEKFNNAVLRSDDLIKKLWSHAETLAKRDGNSEVTALFIDSLNEMIDIQTTRLTVLTYRIPINVLNVIYLITFLSMFIAGYQKGLSGKSNLKIDLLMALTFAIMILLIVDLDRATEGKLRVPQQPILKLQEKLAAETAADR